jgi:ABC-type multidrug transport system fused ATPase/permease subunit
VNKRCSKSYSAKSYSSRKVQIRLFKKEDFSMVGKVWKVLAPFQRTFGVFIVLIVIYEALQIVENYVISMVIRLYGVRAETVVWAGIFIGLLVYDVIFRRLDNIIDYHIIAKQSYPIYKHLKMLAISKFMEMDITWHQERNSGALIGKVNNGVDKLLELIDRLSWEVVPTGIQTLLSMIPMLYFSPWTVVVYGVTLVIFMVITINGEKKRIPLRAERHDRYEIEWHQSVEDVQSVETLIMFDQEGRKLSDYARTHDEIIGFGEKEVVLGNIVNRQRMALLSLTRRAILVIWVWQLYTGTLDVATLVFLNVLSERMFHSLWRIARMIQNAMEASEATQRLINLVEEKTAVEDPGGTVRPNSLEGIKMDQVCFSYKGDYRGDDGTIHNLSLDIKPGMIIAVVGPSGAGKTTLRKLLTRLIDINQGEIYIQGVEIRQWPLPTLRKLFSYVPQGDDIHIFSDTVYANIAVSNPDAGVNAVANAAQLAGIHEFIVDELPQGYETLLGEKGKKLSGGQKQRIALARAILADRQILILDEATSSVDAITESIIQEKMRTILSGKTAIIVAHRLSTVWNLGKSVTIVVMDKGTVVGMGTHDELMDSCALYAKMVNLQKHES